MDKDVMEDAITCTICSEEYSEGIHAPLILPCGHTFCRECITSIQKSKAFACPSCRQKIEEEMFKQLPLNFSILSLSENITQFKPKTCQKHGKLLDLWCGHCQVIVCGLCIATDHRQEMHEIFSAQDHLATMKKIFFNQSDTFNQMISKKQSELGNATKEAIISLLNISIDQKSLKELTSDINSLIEEAYKITTMDSMEFCQARLNSLQSVADNTLQHSNMTKTRENTNDDEASNEQESPKAERETKPLLGISIPELFHFEALSALKISVRNDDNRYGSLIWEDSKLLLSSFEKNVTDSHITIQWNILALLLPMKAPEAFMELHYGEQYLGRVYIRLWGHLRRAHHFLALCLGSLGPSYKDATFRSTHKDDAKERICGCVYKDVDGNYSTKGVMDDLEWDGEFAGKSSEGRVVATSGGKKEMDALFSIYTRVLNKASCYCPFGEVSSGLDIVRRASILQPSLVRISRCGAVIPMTACR